MLAIKTRNIKKTVNCPKCGTVTGAVTVDKTEVNKCKAGCGVWIDQADLDMIRKSRLYLGPVAADQPTGFWRSERFARRN